MAAAAAALQPLIQQLTYTFVDDGYVLPAAYYVRNIPVIQHRLIAAVVRLATLLNSIFE